MVINSNLVSSEIKCTTVLLKTIDQIKTNHKILVNTSSGNQARSQNFNRGKTTTEFQHLNIFNGPSFYSIFHSSIVFRSKPTNKKSALI